MLQALHNIHDVCWSQRQHLSPGFLYLRIKVKAEVLQYIMIFLLRLRSNEFRFRTVMLYQ